MVEKRQFALGDTVVQGPDILLMILDMGRVNTKINKRKSIVSVHPTTYIITM